jgi:hypothetical protein
MTVASREQAIREMFTVIDAALSSLATGGIMYPNRPEAKPAASTPWARVMLRHVEAEQRTIQAQDQLYENEGIVIVQLFEPSGRGLAQSALTTPMLQAFRATTTPGLVWFRRVTASEQGISEHWYQTNVSAIFQYDTVENP